MDALTDDSSDDAERTVPLDLVDLSAGVFAVDTPACEYCGSLELVAWSGRGPKPRFCEDHRTAKKRAAAERAAAAPASKSTPKGKAVPGQGAASAWGMAGYGIQLWGPEPLGQPVGSIMQVQAASIAPHLEWLTKKAIAQFPFLATAGKSNELLTHLAPIIGPPLLTGLIASGMLPLAVAEPILTVILTPLVAEALKQAQNAAEGMTAVTEANAETVAATRDLIAQIFAQPNAEETP